MEAWEVSTMEEDLTCLNSLRPLHMPLPSYKLQDLPHKVGFTEYPPFRPGPKHEGPKHEGGRNMNCNNMKGAET